jgi:sigma-E factor negative regulatory protein RseC
MRQTVRVVREYSHGYIEVELTRVSACGTICGTCTGCSAPKEIIRVKARGGEGSLPGDIVVIESCSRKILGLAALVYLLPLVLFFAGYAVSAFVGGLGFVSGIGLLVPINKLIGKNVIYNVVTQ